MVEEEENERKRSNQNEVCNFDLESVKKYGRIRSKRNHV